LTCSIAATRFQQQHIGHQAPVGGGTMSPPTAAATVEVAEAKPPAQNLPPLPKKVIVEAHRR
jgi:hypothetical protein